MHERRQNINTALFVGFFLLAGIANRFSRTANPAWDSLMTCVNYVVFTGLLVFWIESVRVRLLPSRARTYVLAAALLTIAPRFPASTMPSSTATRFAFARTVSKAGRGFLFMAESTPRVSS